MIENEDISGAKAVPVSSNANSVTLYGNQDAMDDFPVLKAFQQYVDSEQAKAHKRLMTVCAFFTILIFFIIGVFIFVVMNIRSNKENNPDNSMLALQQQVAEQASKMTDQQMAYQRQIADQTTKFNEMFIQQQFAPQPPSPSTVGVAAENTKDKEIISSDEIKNLIKVVAAENMKEKEIIIKSLIKNELKRTLEQSAASSEQPEIQVSAKKPPEAQKHQHKALSGESELKKNESQLNEPAKSINPTKPEVNKNLPVTTPEKVNDKGHQVTKVQSEKKHEDDAEIQKAKAILEHRRRLYPEYFDENGNEHSTPVSAKKQQSSVPANPQDAEIERLKKENEILKLKAENNLLKQKKESVEKQVPADDDADLKELDAILISSGIYGVEEKPASPSDILNINIDETKSSTWTIPFK